MQYAVSVQILQWNGAEYNAYLQRTQELAGKGVRVKVLRRYRQSCSDGTSCQS